jgi:hypothetical protein
VHENSCGWGYDVRGLQHTLECALYSEDLMHCGTATRLQSELKRFGHIQVKYFI